MKNKFEKNDKKNRIKQFLVKKFNKKNTITRLIFSAIAAAVVIICSWPMHAWAMNAEKTHYGDGFIQIDIALNDGVSFSILSGNVAAIYSLQSLMILIILCFLLFCKKWYYVLTLGTSETGAVFNFIDRTVPKCPVSLQPWGIKTNCVLDYLHFSFGKTSFNFPDVFILIGLIASVLIVIILTIIEVVKESKQKRGISNLESSKINMRIIFEDDNIIVVNKPKGILVHPTTYKEKDTLIDALKSKIKVAEFEDQNRPGIVQRLDKDTDGLMVVAKNKKTADELIKQMQNNIFIKKYYAIVHNDFEDDEILINAPIIRSSKNTTKMVVSDDPKAKDAKTKVYVIEHFKNAAFVECELLTGRTHQIRVHMNYIHHPIYNDPLYGHDDGFGKYGQFLTSHYLQFINPTTNKLIEFKIEPDEKFNSLRNYLKNK